ncbi:MAG TPA: glycoside hydrolase family 16 protein [Gemmatimonadales bacterium]|nr:glycoside hydrolase family 16 protein [Gemmatimonadales bacterium]
MQPVPSVDAAVDPVQAAPPSSSQNIAGHVEPPSGAAKPGRVASSDVPPAPPGFALIWKDDFNGAAGQPVEPGKWIYDTGTGYGCAGCPSHWGTFEIETMTSSTRNVSLDGDGNLLITPVRDADGTWTSGRIETRKTNFSAGDHGILRVQAAIQLPATGVGPEAAGYWPAFWMLGAPFRGNYLNWPSIGEIDVMENVNGRPTAFATLHCGVPSGGPCNETSGIGGTIDDATLQDRFHTYAMELDRSVEPNQLRFYLDGRNYFTITATQVPADVWENATDHGFFVILDVAVGGAFPWAECNFFPHTGGCSGSTPFPEVVTPATISGVPMKVAYVAVYSKEDHRR